MPRTVLIQDDDAAMDTELQSSNWRESTTAATLGQSLGDEKESDQPTDTDWSDVGCWPETLNDTQRVFVVETGPFRVTDVDFPLNDNGRHFSSYYYSRKLANGETVDRRWLVYLKKN